MLRDFLRQNENNKGQKNFFFNFLTVLHSMQDASSLTRDQTQVPHIESAES